VKGETVDRQGFEEALAELDALIENPDAREGDFQSWFERHPLVFEVLGYKNVLSHPELTEGGTTLFIPDFLVQRLDGLWEVFEIKRADTEVLNDTIRRADFYSSASKYVRQCREYAKFFNDRSHREEFRARHGEDVQEQPDSTLVAGRSAGLNRQKVHALLSEAVPKVTLQTYDDIRNHLEFRRAKLYCGYENLDGLSVHLVLRLAPPPTPMETVILDIGNSETRDRLKLWTETNGDLVMSVYDSAGRHHLARVSQGDETFQYGTWFYLSVEAGTAKDYAVAVMETNGQYCSESRLTGFTYRRPSPHLPIMLGSDLTATSHSYMDVAEVVATKATLPFSDKEKMRTYIAEQYAEALFENGEVKHWLEYRGHKNMFNQAHPRYSVYVLGRGNPNDMKQPERDLSPILRVSSYRLRDHPYQPPPKWLRRADLADRVAGRRRPVASSRQLKVSLDTLHKLMS
jgi:hypothetical protein